MMKQHFIASVKDGHTGRMDDIAESLRSRGCRITGVLKLSGVITGSVDAAVPLGELVIDGIASVEKDRVLKKKK